MASAAPAPHRFTVDEYHRMAELGLWGEDDQIELVEGEIIDMSPIGPRHAACVRRLNDRLSQRVRERATLGVQDPVRLSDLSEPQPDIAVLRHRSDYYADAHPGPGDVLLLIEVADTSVAFDRGTKVPLYARAGVPGVWLVDLDGEAVEVFEGPGRNGYTETRRAHRGEGLDVAGVTVAVDDILG